MVLNYKKGSRGEMVKKIQRLLHLYPDGVFGSQTEAAVKEFQRKNHLAVDGIVGISTLAKLGLQASTLKKSRRSITEIIIHCTATPEYRDITVTDIRRWHKAQGWSDIGYHYVIYLDGSIHPGRDVDVAGAHTSGHNQHSIGVCYVGGVATDGRTAKDTRTASQRLALVTLLKDLRKLYPQAKIYGHRDFAVKACPSFDARTEYKNI